MSPLPGTGGLEMILGPAGSSVGTLRIPVTRDRDAGIYTCRALNEIGEASAEIRLEVGREWPILGFPALHSHSSCTPFPPLPAPLFLLLCSSLCTWPQLEKDFTWGCVLGQRRWCPQKGKGQYPHEGRVETRHKCYFPDLPPPSHPCSLVPPMLKILLRFRL